MEVSTLFTLGILVVLFGLFHLKNLKRTKILGKPVPGPPVISGIKDFIQWSRSGKLHVHVPDWAKRYGNMVQVNLLLRRTIFVNDAEMFRRLVKDANFRELTNDRPETFIGKYYHYDFKDIGFAKEFGSGLKKKRKIFHSLLKFYGEGKSQFEDLMVTTLEKLVQEFNVQEIIQLPKSIKYYIRSLIGFLLDGDISDEAKSKTEAIADFSDAEDNLLLFENETLLQPFPFLRFIPGFRFKVIHEAMCVGRKNLLNTYFVPMKETFNSGHRRGIIDDLLEIQHSNKKNGEGPDFDDDTVKAIMQNIVAAAYLTTSSTLSSLFLYLIKEQKIQEKVYEEIKRVIGDTTPSFQHRPLMPYTEATILETLRITSNVPFLLPHMARENIVFDRYYIPKNTVLLMNAWHCHHREDYWEDPFKFKPERFLDTNGQLVEPDHPARQRLIPFGVGPRGCPGETFGKSRVFLVTTFLLQKFKILPDDKETLASSDPRDWKGITVLCPDNYKCKVIPRHD